MKSNLRPKVRRIQALFLSLMTAYSTVSPQAALAEQHEIEKLLPKRDVSKISTGKNPAAAVKTPAPGKATKPVEEVKAARSGETKTASTPAAPTDLRRAEAKKNLLKAQAKTAMKKQMAKRGLSGSRLAPEPPSSTDPDMPPVAPKRITRSGTDKSHSAAADLAPAKPVVDAMRSGSSHNEERIQRPAYDSTRIARPSNSTTQNDNDSTRVNRPATEKDASKNAPATTSTSQSPKTAPPRAGSAAPTSATTGGGSAKPAAVELYPQIAKLEDLTFGVTHPDLAIEDRLLGLENAVFARTYDHDSLFDRTERLKSTLLGKSAPVVPPPTNIEPPSGFVDNPLAGNSPSANDLAYLDELLENNENYKKAPKAVVDSFALEMINFERQRRGLNQLEHNSLAQKMADEHVVDLIERGVVSHSNTKGENPDRRYTILGGVDAVNENLAVVNSSELGTSHPCKAAVAKALKQMLMQQDDREALLAPEATHLGFSLEKFTGGTRLVACLEVVSNRGTIDSVPKTAHVGDKIEVVGSINGPYQFDRITLAWEGISELPPQEESPDEALPYFPPLDFIAYREKSEGKNHDKAIFALKTVGMLAAIAGGMFVPPVALAAPLIMMSGPDPAEPKPVSDIPIKGGVKVNGSGFNGKVTLSNDGKEGLYYLTVWANGGPEGEPVAISRRTIVVKQMHDEEDVKGDVELPKAEQKSGDSASPKDAKDSAAPVKPVTASEKNESPAGNETSKAKPYTPIDFSKLRDLHESQSPADTASPPKPADSMSDKQNASQSTTLEKANSIDQKLDENKTKAVDTDTSGNGDKTESINNKSSDSTHSETDKESSSEGQSKPESGRLGLE